MRVLITGSHGYIGSYLCQKLQLKHTIIPVDIQYQYWLSYQHLSRACMEEADAVIHLASHSNVAACEANPDGAIRNNFLNFVDFHDRLCEGQIFIYASSGSVYNGILDAREGSSPILSFPMSTYDITKAAADAYVISQCRPSTFGLRMASVSGASQEEGVSIINAMVKSVRERKIVRIQNPTVEKSILGLNDLCRAILRILERPSGRGVYNLESFRQPTFHIGKCVAERFNVPFEVEDQATPHYSYTMNCQKFRDEFEFHFQDDIGSILGTYFV